MRILRRQNLSWQRSGYRLTIIEKNGVKLENMLVKKDPYAGWDCWRDNCQCCKEKPGGNNGNNCNKQSCLYVAKCEACQEDLMEAEDPDEGQKVGEYVGERCKGVLTQSKAQVGSYRLLELLIFILNHH